MIRELLTRFRFLIFRKKRTEFDEELRFHLEQSIAAKVAEGVPAAEARRLALVEFGGVERARAECERQRPAWWLGTVGQDIRYAQRCILAHGWFSLAIIATLALGIGLNTMVFTLVNTALFKPVPVPGGARLVAVSNRDVTQSERSMRMSYPDLLDSRAQSHSLEGLEGSANLEGVLSEPGDPPQPYHLARATTGIFSLLHIHPILGRDFLPSDAQRNAAPVLMIGYAIWKERYNGSPAVIGKQVRVNEKTATIIGVMPKGFMFPTTVDMWMPFIPSTDELKRDNRPLEVFGILKPGIKMAAAQTDLDDIARRLAAQYPATNKNIGAFVESFNDHYNGGNIKMIFLLMLASVGFVLLIVCANVANMMLSRAVARQREMAIRGALGASRWRILRQLLIESLMLSLLGGVLGFGLAAAGVHWFDLATSTVGRPYWVQFTMDYTVFGYFTGLCILSGLLFGIAPALRFSRPNLNQILGEGARSIGRHRGGTLAAILVIFQFALTLVLLTGAGIFVHSLLRTLDANQTVPADQLLVAWISLPEDRYKDDAARQLFYDALLQRLNALPGVTSASLTSNPPGLGSAESAIEIEHARATDPAHRPQVAFVTASPEYFSTIQLPLLLGRSFSALDGTANHSSAILTRATAARFWPGQSALGKRFRFFNDQGKPGEWITVVGVTANLAQDLMEQDPKPLLFVPVRQEDWNSVSLVVRSTSNPTSAVRSAVQKLDQDMPLRDVFILDAAVEHRTWYLHLFSKIFIGFALIALLIAAVGIYAVLAQATSQRTQEIGVRIALGASVRNIMLLVMRRGLWQIFGGVALGLAGAWPLARLMANLPIGVSPSDPVVFLAVTAMLACAGLVACWLPAHRAATLDPVKAIRCE
ncbi:MAG TPA: ABC transporter permease [Terracidiphilus sp.]|nr:ABC transporter permease [Terracidiphilus sp.]